MNMLIIKYTSALFFIAMLLGSVFAQDIFAQEPRKFTLNDVISIALEQSPDAYLAKHRFRGSYWQLRAHKATYLPSLNLEATLPDINRSISKVTQYDGSDAFVERKLANSSMSLSVNQNVGLTGGKIFINSDLQRIDLLGDSITTSYLSTPVSIGFMQPLFSFNSYRWERKIEPLKYTEAQKEYTEAIEGISLKAVNNFFDLALASLNLSIARINYSNNDTLYKIALGRFNIGTIAQNELLQMELNFLNSGAALNQAQLELEVAKFKLRSFLGYNESIDIDLIVPSEIPKFSVDVVRAKEEALKNNSLITGYQRQLIEAERDVAKARAESRFNANLFASYGLTQSSDQFNTAYSKPEDQQRVSVGLVVPIIDWGLGRGKYKMAQSGREVIKVTIEQAQIDFEQDLFLQVMRFNMQYDQVKIAAKSDTIAQMRYDITKQRFYIGKINVTDLTIALTENDGAKRDYYSALRNYWNYYYNLRKLTLFDFEKNQPLSVEYDKVIKN